MAAPAIFTEKCPYCSRFKPISGFLRINRAGIRICQKCYEWHCRALHVLGTGEPPPGCQECGLSFEDLSNLSPTGDTSMVLVVKDGIYQVLCVRCEAKYLPKRKDLYGETEFWRRKGY